MKKTKALSKPKKMVKKTVKKTVKKAAKKVVRKAGSALKTKGKKSAARGRAVKKAAGKK